MKLTKTFFNDIRELIVSARTTIARGVDLVQVYTNFEIGRRIVEQEQKGKGRAAYGNEVIKALAERLTDEFGGGFSKRNLDYFRRFYLDYADRRNQFMQTLTAQLPESQIMQTLSAQSEISQSLTGKSKDPSRFPSRLFFLSWSHYVLLLGIKNPDELILYQTEDGRTRIECRFEDETIWLTQALIAELFQKDVRTINEHLINIYDEGELDRSPTIRKFRRVLAKVVETLDEKIEHYNSKNFWAME